MNWMAGRVVFVVNNEKKKKKRASCFVYGAQDSESGPTGRHRAETIATKTTSAKRRKQKYL